MRISISGYMLHTVLLVSLFPLLMTACKDMSNPDLVKSNPNPLMVKPTPQQIDDTIEAIKKTGQFKPEDQQIIRTMLSESDNLVIPIDMLRTSNVDEAIVRKIFPAAEFIVLQKGKPTEPSVPLTIPDETRLRKRIELLYKANAAKDEKAFNDLILPGDRRKMFEGHLYDVAQHGMPNAKRILSWKVLQIEIEPMPRGSEKEMGNADIVVKVPMDVRIEQTDGAQAPVEDQTDYWAHSKGEWYWIWRGWPAD
jgi:hypothetical protein